LLDFFHHSAPPIRENRSGFVPDSSPGIGFRLASVKSCV
jgi:hypothetical protein